jgi:hypothetical protein
MFDCPSVALRHSCFRSHFTATPTSLIVTVGWSSRDVVAGFSVRAFAHRPQAESARTTMPTYCIIHRRAVILPGLPTALPPPLLLFLQPVRLFFCLPPRLPSLLSFLRFSDFFPINDLRRSLHSAAQHSSPLTKLVHREGRQAESPYSPVTGFW